VNPVDGGEHEVERVTRGPFRLSAITGHQRVYGRTDEASAAVA
jgi:hypothetical protein